MLLEIVLCAAAAASEPPAGQAATGDAGAPAAVLRIDGPDVFVDLGRGAGARPGDRVRVSRPVRVFFRPGAREPLVDRFAVGEVELVEVGEVLARARPDAALSQKLRLGDVLEPLRPLARDAPRRAEARAAPAPDDGFRQAWLAAQALPPERRAVHWEAYLAAHRDGALEEPLRREIAALRTARAAAAPRAEPVRAPVVSAPARAFEGDPLEVVLSFADAPAAPAPRAALLNWRPSGEALYRPVPFAADGATWRARLPADAARAPGAEWWVGVVDPGGVELVAAVVLAAGGAPVALLPVDAPEVGPEVARAAAEALAEALPAPFRAADLDAAAVREHLAAAGPGCRADLACLCAAAGLGAGELALDASVAPAGAGAWAVDVRVVAPCDGRALDRRAELVPARAAELRRAVSDAVPPLLRGRDVSQRVRAARPPDAPSRDAAATPPVTSPAAAPRPRTRAPRRRGRATACPGRSRRAASSASRRPPTP